MIPISLSESEVTALLKKCNLSNGKGTERLVRFLAKHPESITSSVNQQCAIGNISDIASCVNKKLYHHGFYITCQRPPVPVLNRFGEISNMFRWSLVEVPQHNWKEAVFDTEKEAANTASKVDFNRLKNS
jgi:hypothetical protein|tara:strand:- start:7578 stop:7967 length:390 start_codon:yes stop_codon:yes gene_type:complete